jgi:defect in organelle trafficking protein DotC
MPTPKMNKLLIFITLLLFVLPGCATKRSFDTTNLNDLQTLTKQDTLSTKPMVGKIRLQALKETALTLGAQGGLSSRANQLDDMMAKNAMNLSRIFNFNGLMLDNNVLPPVLEQSKNSLNLAGPNIIRASDNTFKIIQQARFVTTAPTWREYLWLNYSKPELPDSTLLPATSQERESWIKYVNLGWSNGIDQANTIYKVNLAKLQRDYNGMSLYRTLLSQGIVSKPFVAKANIGITSNADNSEISINDRILRITAIPKLNPNSKQWRPILVEK